MSEYTKQLLIAVPEGYLEEANHLILLLGGTPENIKTLSGLRWRGGAYRYAVANMQVKPSFVAALTGDLPDDPQEVAVGYDRMHAELAHSMIGVEGGIRFASNVDMETQLVEWGIKRMPRREL
ncbi:hypothetical protein [Franzmannia qiaohouensis]|uniref:Uncharacterized protein n=1 Tax=Franzmannia qiaohouensis TaxID=1329370 RepID=A0ABU1HAC2_9GAMM|nr:hypothetical protein [Halomonas qiaohouensis]MDR5904417.1 hypothetical protein [Halomonas qiaohouensis]